MVLTKIFKYITNNVRAGDLYAKNITLTYAGKSSYKTIIGGMVSLMIYLSLFVYAWILLSVMFRRKDTKKTVNRTVKDLAYDSSKHYIGKSTFAFAFTLFDNNHRNLLLDPTYFVMTIEHIFYNRTEDGEYTSTSDFIDVELWGQNFPHVEQDLYNRIGLENYACPKRNDYYLSADFYSDLTAQLEIKVKKCENTTENNNHWKPDSEIVSWMSNRHFHAAILSAYFDYEDYTNPIKTFVEDTDIMTLIDGFWQSLEVKVQQNFANLADSLFYSFGYDTKSYYNAGRKIYKTENIEYNSGNSAIIYISLDRVSEQYERVVYSFIDMCGFLGGLYDFMFFFGYLIISTLTERLYYSDIFQKLYHIRTENSSKKLESDISHVSKENVWTYQGYNRSKTIDSRINRSDDHKDEVSDLSCSDYNTATDYLYRIKQELRSRRRFDFSIIKVLKSSFRANIWWNKVSKSHKYYDHALELYKEELDCKNFVMNIRLLKTLVKLNMNSNQI